MFTHDQQNTLLALAREAIYTYLDTGHIVHPDVQDALFREPLGAFVTLTRNGELRGCIGFPEPVYPLYETIIRGGIAAAVNDPRFPPVSLVELETLAIEISVLSPLARITPDKVVVGTHGLVIEQGMARGLLLPQVPVEWGWDREQFLAQTCRKAGLPTDAWQRGAILYGFTAHVFSERELSQIQFE